MSNDNIKAISMFLDGEGRIKQLPVKFTKRLLVLEYLAAKFSSDRNYAEKEVNEIIDCWHTFGDYFILRRELIDNHLLCRTPNGERYWKEKIVVETSDTE